MLKHIQPLLNALTMGKKSQSFLGAWWIAPVLKLTPKKYQRRCALFFLGISPHYFYRDADPEYQKLSLFDYLDREFRRNAVAREKICERILIPKLAGAQTVLDYGCGPGFLANAVSEHTSQVYAVDLSSGVLECARILNGKPNITFLDVGQLNEIKDNTIDLVYSFAVFQHVTDEILEGILSAMIKKLKKGGKLVFHIVLDDDNWLREQDWSRDLSLKGRLKMKYGLNCFAREEKKVKDMLESLGYTSIAIRSLKDLCLDNFDDICTQHLICAICP